MIEVKEVAFDYPNGVRALRSVSCSIAPGERVAIVGQNGAGKSTLSRLLNGLTRPSAGSVIIDGLDTQTHRPDEIARKVGYVFQNPDDQIFSRTIWDECAYALKKTGVPDAEAEERVAHALRICGFTGREDLNPLDLPLAERKFVTTAAAIALRPTYLVLDEPTAGLDDIGRDLLVEILGWAEGEGISVIAVSHDMRFVIEWFPRVIVMAQGQVVIDGTREQAFSDAAALTEASLNVPPAVSIVRDAGAVDTCLRMSEIETYLSNRL